jgi:hypothetical protein
LKQNELRPIEKEIVEINYGIRAQENRKNEFIQARDDAAKKYREAGKEEKEPLKIELDRSKLKATIEFEKYELLQLKLQERIANLEYKKSAMVATDSDTVIQIAKYEKFHKFTKDEVTQKEKKIRLLEQKYKTLEADSSAESKFPEVSK